MSNNEKEIRAQIEALVEEMKYCGGSSREEKIADQIRTLEDQLKSLGA